MTDLDFDTLLRETRERASTDPEFAKRLGKIVLTVISSEPSATAFIATGAIGMALHMDDKMAGRV